MSRKPNGYVQKLEKRIDELEAMVAEAHTKSNENRRDKLAFKIVDFYLKGEVDPMRVVGPSALLEYNPFAYADYIIEGKTLEEFKEYCKSRKP